MSNLDRNRYLSKSETSELVDWLDRNRYHAVAIELRRLQEENAAFHDWKRSIEDSGDSVKAEGTHESIQL